MKKWVKKLCIGLGIVLIIVLLANFGLNIWLKTQLPGYIKNNTAYRVTYKKMEVDLLSGNILSTGITVGRKNPLNTDVIGLQGTVDTLKISRFGIYDAVFNKQISSSDLLLARPDLTIVLAKPADRKTGKKRNPVAFENIRIRNGNIRVFRHTLQKLLSVQDLDLYVENLQMTEESVKDRLPVVFDRYGISGRNFFVRPDDVYAVRTDYIKTTGNKVSVKNFQLVPVIPFEQFKKYYPKKNKLFQFTVPEMTFTDILLKDNKVSLANARFSRPDLLVYTTSAVPVEAKKPSDLDISLENVKLDHAVVQVMKPDGNKMLYAGDLTLHIDKLKFDKETREELIPVGYKNFLFSVKDLWFSNHQDFKIGSVDLTPQKGTIRNISVVPNTSAAGKTSMNLMTDEIAFHINKWGSADKKLVLDVKDVLIGSIKGKITAGEAVKKITKPDFKGIQFPLMIRKIMVKESDITYEKDGQPLALNGLQAEIGEVRLLPKTDRSGIAIENKDYHITTKNIVYQTRFYKMTTGFLKADRKNISLSNFVMKPSVSRAQFIRMIPVERDLYDIKVPRITAAGTWDLFSQQKSVNASRVTVQSADAVIFRSKIPADDPKEKPLYSRMLRSIGIPLTVDHLALINSKLVYEEDTPESAGPGKLTFSNFDMDIRNLNSAKVKGKPTRTDIRINCTFMNLAPLAVNWHFDVADQRDIFYISGKTTGLPAAGINPFIRPYLHVSATGTIQEMIFNFKGDPKGLNGSFNLRHKDLKVAILDKENREKKGLLSAVANLFVKSDSGKLPEDVKVEDVERDPTKSFFNLFWKGIEQGLKKTLIGVDIGGGTKKPDAAGNNNDKKLKPRK
ncbi:hypothetical protein [uncultured Chryseobacterium sp.]|uniref:hypothetical protein n=1 Tax=uncultured Chryseobacterium sp. TaxID=259322 RepID=UPI0025CD1947|nr:hypothetical protein [uncultured Chryseobacterium sp.]